MYNNLILVNANIFFILKKNSIIEISKKENYIEWTKKKLSVYEED